MRSPLLAPALLAALAIAFTVRPLDDFDLWYHLAAGRQIWTSGRLPTTNVFASTAGDHPDVDVYWLYQLALFGAYAAGGHDGCILLAVGLVLATVAVLYATARRRAPPALVAFLLGVALVVASPRLVPRPELAAYLLLALFLWVLDDYPRTGRAIYALVPLQVLWTNAHGTVPSGILLAACYWLGATMAFLPLPRGWRLVSAPSAAEWRRLTLVLVLVPLACLLNPWGVAGARLPVDMLAVASAGSAFAPLIGELQPPLALGHPVITEAWLGLLVLAGLSFAVAIRRWHLGRLLAVAAFAVLSVRAFRALPLFAWVAVPAIAANLGMLRIAARVRAPAAAVAMLALVTLIGLVVTNRFSRLAELGSEFRLGVSRLRVPAEAVDFVREVGIASTPFNTSESGGYLAWRLHPAQRVFIDGRGPAYPETVWRDFFRLLREPGAWPELAAQYRFDWALVYHRSPAFHPLAAYLAAGHGWTIVYHDALASLYLPTDESHRELRERAEHAFAERRAARLLLPAARGSLWRSIAVPIEEPQREHSYGDFLRAMGWHGEAFAAYERALRLDPGLIWARYKLGLAAWYAGNPDRAVAEWREVLRRDPRFAPARQALDQAGTRDLGAAPGR